MSIQEREKTETQVVTRRDVLHRAADLIEEFGWCQGDYGSKAEGKFCIYGAMDEAYRELIGDRSAAPMEYGILFHRKYDGCATYNDAPGRTSKEVVTAIRALAETAS